ncbi:MAG: hypothetical protein RLN96_11755, partial [Pseudomonadales bacterium]
MISLPQLPRPNNSRQSCFWPKGNASAMALSIARNLDSEVALVVTSSAHMAQELNAALEFFVGDSHEIIVFPDYETLAYDFFSPGEDLISD